MDKKRVKNLILVALFAIGYIAFLVVVIYGLASVAPPGGEAARTPVFEHVMPWGF